MKKLAILFPGVGYTCVKPLLYYTASLASDHGYEIMKLDYGEDIHTFKGRSMEELEPLAEKIRSRVIAVLGEVKAEEYEDILMISKSIGTVAACMAEKELGWHVRHFLMTPVPAAFPLLGDVEGCFVAGTADPFTDAELIRKAAKKYPDKVGAIFEDCNHSLEKKGDTFADLCNIKTVLDCMNTKIFDKGSRYPI